MRLSRQRRSHRPMLNMTPMIDIVFLLLIFFMTVNQVTEVNKERLQLPQLEGSQDQESAQMTINVTRDGELRVAGQTIGIAQVVALIEQELVRLGGQPNRLSVVVRSDQQGASKMTNEVIRALGQLGIARVRIAVEVSE